MKVAIVMGSDSDLNVMKDAEKALREFKIPFVTKVVSAHRTPKKMYEFAQRAMDDGFEIIIAGAGGAAHLPGMLASLCTLPVIGVPIALSQLNGIDSLLSIVQMPKGVPVATVAINNAYNAGLLAVRILANQNQSLRRKLDTYSNKQIKKVNNMNKNLKRGKNGKKSS